MKRNLKLTSFVFLFVLALVLAVVQDSQAYKISWYVGQSYTWGAKEKIVTQFYNQTQDINKMDFVDEKTFDIKLNITEINIITMNFECWLNIGTEDQGLVVISFDWQDWIDDELTTERLFECEYTWDTYENRTILINAQLSINPYILLYPNLARVNENIKKAFNTTYVIDSVYNPVLGITENFTVGTFLGNSSYSIMGKSNLNNGLSKFTEKTRHWTLSFDLSNYLMADKLDYGFSPGYYPYEYYRWVFDLEYEEGGMLQRYSEKAEKRFVLGNSVFYDSYEFLVVFGGIESLTADFYFISFILGLVVISILLKFVRKKKA